MKSTLFVITFVLLLSSNFLCQTVETSQKSVLGDVEIVENLVERFSNTVSDRRVFMYLPEEKFSFDNISLIFSDFSRKHCDPYTLTIYLFTDKIMLEKQLRFERNPIFIEFNDTDEGKKVSQRFYSSRLPAETGYFRGYYDRYGDYELIKYTVSRSDPELKRVYLRRKEEGTNARMPANPCVK